MPNQLIKLRKTDELGIIKDTPALALPPQAFSDGRNIRFRDGVASKMRGNTQIFNKLTDSDGNSLNDNVRFAAYWPNPNKEFYVYASDSDIYTIDIDNNIQHIGTGYNTVADWDSTLFGGGYNMVMNNGSDTPIYITDSSTDGTNITVANLPGWNYRSGFSIVADNIVGYDNVLVAGNFTETNTTTNAVERLPAVVRVSTQAPNTGIPATWQPGTNADTADEFPLSNTSPITAMVPIQSNLAIYTTNSIHLMRITSTSTVVQTAAEGYGALTKNCVVEYDGKHFVVGSDDIYQFTGTAGQIESLAEARVRDAFYGELNYNYLENIRIVRNKLNSEIWILFASTDSIAGNIDRAYIYNYQHNVWTIRDVTPNLREVTTGFVPGGGISGTTLTFTGSGNTGDATDRAYVKEVQTLTVDADMVGRNYRYDSEIVRVTSSGTRSNVVVDPVNEIFSLDIQDDIGTADSEGTVLTTNPGIGAGQTTTSFTLTGSNTTINLTDEILDSDGNWSVSGGRLVRSVSDSGNYSFSIFLRFSAPLTEATTIAYNGVRGSLITPTGFQPSVTVPAGVSYMVTGGTNGGFSFSATDYTGRVRIISGQSSITVTEARVAVAASGSSPRMISRGPSDYIYSIRNDADSELANGYYQAPLNDSDEDAIVAGLRNHIITTANASTNATLDSDWSFSDRRVRPVDNLSSLDIIKATNIPYGTSSGQWGAETGSGGSTLARSAVTGWNWTTGNGFIMAMRQNVLSTANAITVDNWIADSDDGVFKPMIITPTGRTDVYGIYDVDSDAFRYSSNAISFRAGTAGASNAALPISNGFVDSEGGFPSSGNFDLYWGVDTNGNDVEIARVSPLADSDVAATAPDFNVTFSGSVNFTTGTTLVINEFTRTVTSSTVTTIEGFVDALVGTYTSTNNGTITVSKVNASTIRVLYSVAQAITTLSILNQTFTSNTNGVQPTATIGSTTLTNSGSPTFSFLFWSGFSSGNFASRRSYIQTNTDHNFALNITSRTNESSNAAASLNASSLDTDGVTRVGQQSVYTITDPSNTQVDTFNSSVPNSSSSDASTVRTNIINAINNNTETPIDFSAVDSEGNIILTAAERGPIDGNWSIASTHGTLANENNEVGNLSFTPTITTDGSIEHVVGYPTATIVSPEGDEYVITLDSDATGIASRLAGISDADWTVTASGRVATFTQTARGAPVSGEWDCSTVTIPADNESANVDSESFVFANPTQGVVGTDDAVLTFTYNPGPRMDNVTITRTFRDRTISQVISELQNYVNQDAQFSAFTGTGNQGGSFITINSSVLTPGSNEIVAVTLDPGTVIASNNVTPSNIAVTINIDSENDPDRPWPTNSFNLAKEFIVGLTDTDTLQCMDVTFQMDGQNYTSYVERKNMDLDEVFDQATLKALRDVYFQQMGDWNFRIVGTNVPQTDIDIPTDRDTMAAVIDGTEDYKMSIQQTARFLNIRFDDAGLTPKERNIVGYSLDVTMDGEDS